MSDVEIERVGEFHSDLVERLVGPIAEPIEYASIEERWRGRSSRGESFGRRIHRENYV